MKKILVCGAGGFIGTHLVTFLKKQGYYVIGADIKHPEYSKTNADEFYIVDLTNLIEVEKLFEQRFYEVYQLAADMGGAGYLFTGKNDAKVMSNSALINLNILNSMLKYQVNRIFFSSSACVYNTSNQISADNVITKEESAYPAEPDSEYGWEKLFSERLFLAYARNFNLHVRIARLHGIFGTLGAYNNGKEKSVAAICRKIAQNTEEIEVWNPGIQSRSYLYVDECVLGIYKIMNNSYGFPLNLGSTESITLNNLVSKISKIANKKIKIKYIDGPIGVMHRNSDNELIKKVLNWSPAETLDKGLKETYYWIEEQIKKIN